MVLKRFITHRSTLFIKNTIISVIIILFIQKVCHDFILMLEMLLYLNMDMKSRYREQPIEWDAINFARQKRYINVVDKQLITYEGSWEK